MKIDKELEIEYIRIIQKRHSERTISEGNIIKKRNHLIESQFVWKPKVIEKLILLNEKLREEEKRVFTQYLLVEKQCQKLVKNKTINDYTIDLELSYWNNKHYKKYDPSIEDNPFFISIDNFMIHQLERAEYDSSPQNEHHEKTPLSEISHCHSFHSLYDHCHELTWFDIYNIDEFWMEIKVHYQFQNDLTLQNKRSKREIVSHKTIRGALNNNLIKGVAHHIACPTSLYLSSPLANYSFSPLVIIGEYILGQSHLVGVIGNEINSCYPDKNLMYVSTSDFIQEYDGSIKKNKRNKLKKSCLSTDVLIIQHIELLSGKSATQQIMTEIVNHFIQNEKQIILTSEMALTELADINPQLLSRFKSGLTIELSMPAFEMRIAIIKNIMSNSNVKITEDIITYIARNNLLNTEELYEFCHSLKDESSFNKQEITFTLAKTLIEKLKMK